MIISSVSASSIVAGKAYASSFTIFLIVPLKILPLLVFGSFDKKMTPSSLQKAPTSVLMAMFNAFAVSSSASGEYYSKAPLRITKASGHSPLTA